MNIYTYLNPERNKTKVRQEFAERLGVSVIAVKKWAYGTRYPRRAIWPDIVRASGGKVTMIGLADPYRLKKK